MALSDCLQWLQWQDIPAGTSVCGTSSLQCGQYPCATCEHIQSCQQCKEYLESIKKASWKRGWKILWGKGRYKGYWKYCFLYLRWRDTYCIQWIWISTLCIGSYRFNFVWL